MNRIRRAATIAALLSVGVAAVPAAAGAATAKPKAPADTQKARTFPGTPTVGAVFNSATGATHICTATVVASPHGDVLITAAHCLRGSVKGWSFAPGFDRGFEPYGRWRITGAYLDSRWLHGQSPLADYAFLTVAPQKIDGVRTEVQQVVGSNRLGTAPRTGQKVTVNSYPAGTDNAPITCTAAVYFRGVYPAFNCNPYVDGTSGSAWLEDTPTQPTVVGVIGGPHQGGCFTWTSYSSPLGPRAHSVYERAVRGATPDVAPMAESDGCTTGL